MILFSCNTQVKFVTFTICFYCAAAEESMKDTSEPTGSPAPVIQHSSLAPSPSMGQNGLRPRAAAEAMAMSVLAGMGQSQRAESGSSHIIMAAQSHSTARWWAMSSWPRLGSLPRVRIRAADTPYPSQHPPSRRPNISSFARFLSCALCDPTVEPSRCGLELSNSSLLGTDWDFWESFLITLPQTSGAGLQPPTSLPKVALYASVLFCSHFPVQRHSAGL